MNTINNAINDIENAMECSLLQKCINVIFHCKWIGKLETIIDQDAPKFLTDGDINYNTSTNYARDRFIDSYNRCDYTTHFVMRIHKMQQLKIYERNGEEICD